MSFDNLNNRVFGAIENLSLLGNRSKGAPQLVLLVAPTPGTPLADQRDVDLRPGLYLVSAQAGIDSGYAFGEWPSRFGAPKCHTLTAGRVVVNPGPGIYLLQLADPSIIPWTNGAGFVVGPPSGFAWYDGVNVETSDCELLFVYQATRRTVVEVKEGEVIEIVGSHGTETIHVVQVADGWESAKNTAFMRVVNSPDHTWHDPNREPQGEMLPPDGSQRVIRILEGEHVELYCRSPKLSGVAVNFVPIGSSIKTGERD
jgi:hypothetical protein